MNALDLRNQAMVTVDCCTCGVMFAVPKTLNDRWLNNRNQVTGLFYCPNGHNQHYTGPTEAAKLKIEVERLTKEKEWKEQEAKVERERADKAEARERRLKARAKAGVCPCCKRTVAQMAKHMATKHPEFKP